MKHDPIIPELIRHGFEKRIMFGSDQMTWPDAIGLTVEAIEKADFLSAEQKRDILYNNAARAWKCPHCHSDNPEDTSFCGKCWTKLVHLDEVLVSQTKTSETPQRDLTKGSLFAGKDAGRRGENMRIRIRPFLVEVAVICTLFFCSCSPSKNAQSRDESQPGGAEHEMVYSESPAAWYEAAYNAAQISSDGKRALYHHSFGRGVLFPVQAGR
ncbi:MAG: amidohydrolase family protein [Candidatus Aminicenantales bacterium]